ncbi:hypothetical protein [Nocardioides nanhaiensis]|uniref:Uncharacterized protein n=1 Tax=Nocardioides nanhaiensis TaxID=1476871 RepID=A0ABP8WU85_9ACTN
MENTEHTQLRESLRAAERAEAAPWIDYPPTPAWYPVSVALWAAALTMSFAIESTPVRLVVVFALVGLELGFIVWYRRYRGTMPAGKVPPELARPFYGFMAANLAIAGGALLIARTSTVWAAAIFVFVVVIPSLVWYERSYARAAARTRARLDAA